MKKVILVVSNTWRGGVETLARDIGRAAIASGIEIEYLITHDWGGPLLSDYQSIGKVTLGFDPERPPALACDRLHVFNNFNNVLRLVDALDDPAKAIVSVHWPPDTLLNSQSRQQLFDRIRKLGVTVLADSFHVRKKIGATYIPNLADSDTYVPLAKDESSVLWVGRLNDNKGVADLLTVVGCTRHVRSFTVVTPTPTSQMSERYLQLLKGSASVRVMHDLSDADMAKVFGRAGWYLQTSHYEGTSMALLQAMAAECEVVASRAGNTAVVLASGKAGHLYRVANPDAAIRVLLAERQGLGAFARSRAIILAGSPEPFLEIYRS